ncbi:Gfo/Idh/MocA family oxidoreductase [Desulfohalobiaceae bacterium Ax17]|uniref:Gfo/Idh/MocA family protein n=1 Tax=Desulfovulcanus ferrireducens TaxID=2831190 RepID=UPI00207BBAF1|nr:Gfo/Idh/MocA family oxidoreductase [Desulfovulcanus ferrireducens]MBT8763517.1 Gfo/Idh/MocA family oxidoreductase [Desulfovulcanus ferrireducens]
MRTLIIGFGSIGKRHAKVLKELYPNIDIHLVTSQEINAYKTYSELKKVSNIDKFDYFIIASETYKHFPQLKFLENTVENKTILVEKPLFIKKENLKIKKNNVYVGYNLRFHPIIQEIKNKTKNEKIIYVNAIAGQYLPTWRPERDYRKSYCATKEKGGGVLLDLSHEIDYIQHLFGKINHIEAKNTKISDLEIDSDDLTTAIGKTNKGTIINFSIDYISKIPKRSILVHTLHETIIGDLIQNTLCIGLKNLEKKETKFSCSDRNYTYRKMHEEIIEGRFRDLCTFDEGLEVIDTIDKIRNSEICKEW